MVDSGIKKIVELMQGTPSREMVQKIFLTLDYNPGGPGGMDEPYIDDKADFGIASAEFIAHYADFGIIHLEMARTGLKEWKSAARRVFRDYIESMVICTAPGENRLLLSNHYQSRKKGEPIFESRMRHIPLEIESEGLSRPVKEWLDAISIPEGPKLTTFELMERINGAFDNYAKQLQNNLQENVYEALRSLAQGLIDVKKNKVKPTKEGLEEAREELFFLLYRILFVLYAEDRGLLPIDNEIYFEKYSISKLKKELILPIDKGEDKSRLLKKVAPDGLWNHLDDLFELINLGSEALGMDDVPMPAYNGRLFSNETAEGVEKKLANWKFTDDSLVDTLSFLFRAEDRDKNPFFINYSTLETRHLGSVYEGLLEYRMRIAEEPMVAVKSGKTLAWKPASEASSGRTTDRVEAGAIYLETDKGERKATGSYYTPNYIVEYIVKHTVGPLVRQKLAETHVNCEAQGLLGPLPESETEEPGVSPQDYSALVAAQPDSMKQDGARDAAWNAILSLKVLDPAMGSGHFLVGALHYLAQAMVTCDGRTTGNQEKRFIDAKREAVRRCLYGVDLNPLAVELAKVSLWLETVAAEKPLSFLDHHLKCGNSLIGARLEDLHVFPEETVKRKGRKKRKSPTPGEGQGFFDVVVPKPIIERFTVAMQKVEGLTDDNIEAVHEKEEAYIALKRHPDYLKIRDLCDLKTSLYFDNEMGGYEPKARYQDIVWSTLKGSEMEWAEAKDRGFMRQARELTEEKRFFHWELEFPEVFYEGGKHKGEAAGFDAVVGNPPYVRQEQLEKNYFQNIYNVYSGRADLYVYFLENEITLIKTEGKLGIIVSNKFTEVDYGNLLMNYIITTAPPSIVINLADLPVFENVTVYTMVAVLNKSRINSVEYIQPKNLINFPDNSVRHHINIDDFTWKAPEYLYDKLAICSRLLSESYGSPLVGIKTGAKNCYYAPENFASEFAMPYIFGKNIGRYEIRPPIRNLIFPYERLNNRYERAPLEKLQGASALLEQNRKRLEKRAIIRDKILQDENSWYEYQQINHNINYKEKKIVYPNVSDSPRFTLDDGFLIDMTAFVIPSKSLYLLTVLNSKIIDYLVDVMAVKRRGGYSEWRVQYLEKLPIRRVFFHTPAAERKAAVARLQKHYTTGSSPYEPLLALVEECLPHEADGTFAAFGPRAVNASDDPSGLDANGEPLERSDVVHDLLAFLAEEMMALNKQKQALVRKALDGVAAETGLSVDDWKLKTKVQKFWQEPDSEWVRAMRDRGNVKRFTNTGKKSEDKIVRNLSKAKEKLQPILEKIDDTDRLIDQIVYRLYGLTEEEIAIVEG